jgi:hypothetical protein
MGEKRKAYRILVGKPGDHWENHDVGGWKILKWILQTDRMGWCGLD